MTPSSPLAPTTLVERLRAIVDYKCPHDMGYDREIGPLGCALEGNGGCFCASVVPAAREAAAALSTSPAPQAGPASGDGAKWLRKLRRILTNSEMHETTRVVDAIDTIDAALASAQRVDAPLAATQQVTDAMATAFREHYELATGQCLNWQCVYNALEATIPNAASTEARA